MKRISVFLALCLTFSGLSSPVQANIQPGEVAVTIAPLHSLVANIMQDVGEPALILPSNQSVHGMALKPSQRRAIHDAKLLFYVDEHFELFLPSLLKQSPHLRAEPLSATAGLVLKSLQSDHHHDKHDHNHHHEAALVAKPMDYHFWLSPEKMLLVTQQIAKILKNTYPDYEEAFEANRLRLENRILKAQKTWQLEMRKVKDKPFVVFHDAYQYLVDEFDLRQAGAVTLSPELPSSAKHMQQLHDAIEQQQVACVFVEPQFGLKQAQQLSETYGLRVGTLDPLGAGIAKGSDFYFLWMQQLITALKECLGEKLVVPLA